MPSPAAYSNASRLIPTGQVFTRWFRRQERNCLISASFLPRACRAVVDAGKVSDKLSLDLVNGKANVVDVVTAISQTEMAMESMVAIRDKVISAYEEIMRMPI